MQDLSSLLPKPCLHSLLGQALFLVFPGCNKHRQAAWMVGERERSQVQVGHSAGISRGGSCRKSLPQAMPWYVCIRDCLLEEAQTVALFWAMTAEPTEHLAAGRGVKSACPSPGTSSPPPSISHSCSNVVLPWGCGAAAWGETRALQWGRSEPCKSHSFTALLKTVHTFCSQAALQCVFIFVY